MKSRDILNMHSLRASNMAKLRADEEINKSDQPRLNEKMSVKVEPQPLFEQQKQEENKTEEGQDNQQDENFGLEKVQIFERDFIQGKWLIQIALWVRVEWVWRVWIGVSAPVEEVEEKPKKNKKKSLFAEMMVSCEVPDFV